jgi:hypothetical protein
MEIMKQMLKAKTSIDFVMFTFAQSSRSMTPCSVWCRR